MPDTASPKDDLLADWPADDRQLFYAIAGASETQGRSFVTPADELQRGSVVAGAYRLEQILGVGGMGVAWLAQQLALDRLVVVKLMRQQQADQSTAERQRFVREARAAAAVQHPHVVTVHDLGHHDGSIPFMVMERLEGESLDKYVRVHGPIHWSQVQGLVAQLLDALSAVHSAGIVHRDLKPSNLMLLQSRCGSEFVKLIDFGIAAKPLAQEPALTEEGAVPGSLSYMSPEQMAGRADHRSDLYSVGCIILYLLSGRTPLPGVDWTPTRIRQVVARGRPTTAQNKEVDSVVAFLMKLLAPNCEHRFADAETALDALQCLPDPTAPADRPVTIVEAVPQTAAHTNRWRALPSLVATSAISAVVGLQWGGYQWSTQHNEATPSIAQPTARPTLGEAETKTDNPPAERPAAASPVESQPDTTTQAPPGPGAQQRKVQGSKRNPGRRPRTKRTGTERNPPRRPEDSQPKNPGWLPSPPREFSGSNHARPQHSRRLGHSPGRFAHVARSLPLWSGLALLVLSSPAAAATGVAEPTEPDIQLDRVASQLQATMESGNFRASAQRCRQHAAVRENSSDLEMADYTDYLCASAFTELIAGNSTQALRDATVAHMQILRRTQDSHSAYSKQLRQRSTAELVTLARQWRARGRVHEAKVICACTHSQGPRASLETATCPRPRKQAESTGTLAAIDCHVARLQPPRTWMLVHTVDGPKPTQALELPWKIRSTTSDSPPNPRARKHTALWAWLGSLGTLGGAATIAMAQLMEPMMVASGRLRQPWTAAQRDFMNNKFPRRQAAWTAGGAVLLGAGLSALITATVQHARNRRTSAR